MAIDGRIRNARRWDDCVVIRIGGHVENNRHVTLPGQRRMVIENATYLPQSGQAIWGGSSSVRIEPLHPGEPTRVYQRKGYTRLVEV